MCILILNIQLGKAPLKVVNERREKVWFLMLQGSSPQQIKKTLNITNTIVYNDLNALTQKSKQYVYDMAKGTHVLLYQRAIEGIGLVLSECWKVYTNTNDNCCVFSNCSTHFCDVFYVPFARGDSINPGVYSINSKPFGISYGNWTAKWEQWLLSEPQVTNPATDQTGKNCGENQKGPVWFLAGTPGGTATRTCTIPAGKAILFGIINN